MGIPPFRDVVTSAEELARVIGLPSELVIKKQRPELDAHMERFIAESPFLLLGTVGRDGSCDVSPRGDVPGRLAAVRDARTLVIPERRGNRPHRQPAEHHRDRACRPLIPDPRGGRDAAGQRPGVRDSGR